ncbi:fungal hydrophobin [Colletotrichum incanum]|uniref:Fungal hydrophobin n=1 Tax=Colletotrichum incanum TaxID=1573173 RepID=A0A161WFR4_COLIC|nr:fungal hydrophobin [Colletotrichum incanum]
MHFTVALVALFASATIAIPTTGHGGNTGPGSGGTTPSPYDPCSGLYNSVQCCATDVLGVANLDCGAPPSVPTSADSFSKVCAAIGQRARCCVLPILGQGILCQTPFGVKN